MGKIVSFERLIFCADNTDAVTSEIKGAGWVVRSSELQISVPAMPSQASRYDLGRSIWYALLKTPTTRIQRVRRLLQRKGSIRWSVASFAGLLSAVSGH